MRYYTASHEWINYEGDIATVGITDYAQTQLGDIVFVELPSVGSHFAQGAEAAVVESVKAASEVYMPCTGEIIEMNGALEQDPSLVNSAAQSEGWFFKCRLTVPEELEGLMDEAAYQQQIKEEG